MRQFRDWQHTKGAVEPPAEYIDYVLCHEVYHCTPDQLDRIPAATVQLHLAFWTDEQTRKQKKQRVMRGRPKRRGEYERTRNSDPS